MNPDDIEHDLDLPQDETERKIKNLENKLAKVSIKEDKKILWGAASLIIFIILYKVLNFNPIVVIAVIPFVVFGGIAMVIFENNRKKKDILINAGLRCSKCGYLPKIINAPSLYYSKRCPKYKDLNTFVRYWP